MEHIFQNLLCFMTTHCTALALYYSTWVNIRWHLSCSPSIVHMSSRGVQCTLQPPYLWFSNCLIAPCHLGASPGVFLIRILRSQLLPMDSFSLGQYQCVSVSCTHSHWNTKELSSCFYFWAPKSLTGQILSIFSCHCNTYYMCMMLLPERNTDG